jgi:hypothetical protein
MATLAHALGLPPGVTFKPAAYELIQLFLLPRVSGRAEVITGVVIEEDGTGAAMPPWDLLERHGRSKDDEAYFFERISEDDVNKDRSCGGSWTWVIQRSTLDTTLRLPGGEEVKWDKRDLNLHRGRKRSGSTGWVMHEYIITAPKCFSPVKLCHIAFTGHGQKRQRLPDEVVESERVQHTRAVAASSSFEASATTFVDRFLPLEQDQERFLNQHTYGFLKHLQPPSFEGSSALTCSGSDVGSSQDSCPGQQELAYDHQQSQNHDYEDCGTLLARDFGASQEPLPWHGQVLTQEQLFQQQSQNNEYEAYGAFLPQDFGASQEPLPCQGQVVTQEQLFQQQSQNNDYEAYTAFLAQDFGAGQEPLPGQGQVLTQEQLFQQQLLNNLLAASRGNNAETSNNGECIIQMTEGTGMMPPLMDQGCLFDNLEDLCNVPPLDENDYNGNMAIGDGGGGAFEDQSTQM